MKNSALALLALALAGTTARAQVTVINSTTSSFASIQFDDTLSVNTSSINGITNVTQTQAPWNGLTWAASFLPDPNTGDTAQGDITAAVISGNYDIAFANIKLQQLPLNTGFARLVFTFSVEFQLGILGLPSQPTLFPNFVIDGTVQSPSGSFALLVGSLNYSGTVIPGTISNVETVNYNFFTNTPGAFSTTVLGSASSGTTPALLPFTTLTIDGSLTFIVDPANINAESVAAPEPGSALLALSGAALLGLRRRRA